MKIRKVTLPGSGEVSVRDVDFDVVREDWSVYKLKDGGTVRIRATALVISRLLDAQGKPTYLPDGSPAILVNNQVQVVATETD